MKKITKRESPREFEDWKNSGSFSYNNITRRMKKIVKKSLLKEQGYICCYCGKRILNNGETSIEHFLPKGQYPHLSLEYSNLHASCFGGKVERQKMKEFPLSCDPKKDKEIVSIDLLNDNCENKFIYKVNGEIYEDPQVIKDIKILGLNNSSLIKMRKSTINGRLYKKVKIGNRIFNKPKEIKELKKELENIYLKNSNNMFNEYCFVIKSACENLIKIKEAKIK